MSEIEQRFAELMAEARTPSEALAWRRAERAFFQQSSPGRPAIDDRAALDEVQALMQSGRTKHAALTKVSRRVAGHGSSKAVYERLRRKLAAKNHPQNSFRG